MARPAISMAGLFAPPEMPLPRVKTATTPIITYRRPKMSASWPMSGRKTVLVRKYELANHTYRSPASRASVMDGSAVDVTVDSTAASIEVRHRAGKVAQNRQPLVVGPASSAGFSSAFSSDLLLLCGVLGGWSSALSPAWGGDPVAASAMARRKECLVDGAKRLVCRRCRLWLLSSCYITSTISWFISAVLSTPTPLDSHKSIFVSPSISR